MRNLITSTSIRENAQNCELVIIAVKKIDKFSLSKYQQHIYETRGWVCNTKLYYYHKYYIENYNIFIV